VPSACCIDECSGRLRSKRSATVECVTLSFNKWVIATALLPHELEQLIGDIRVNPLSNRECERSRRPDFHDETSAYRERTEVQLCMPLKLSPRLRGRSELPCRHDFAAVGVHNSEFRRQWFAAKNNRRFNVTRSKTKLVYADIELLLLRINAGRETDQGCDQRQAGKNANHLSSGDKNLDRVFTTCL